MRPAVFALVDCDEFYVSCERVFAPRLKGRPVVVLSNNDGCVISRSREAKEIGVAMGAPLFKVRALLEANGAAVFSSNYELYGDMSRRVMQTLEEFAPRVEVYSIDEAFLSVAVALPAPTDYTPELIGHARRGVEMIYRAGCRFKKAGVMLLDLVPAAPAQSVMFDATDRARAG